MNNFSVRLLLLCGFMALIISSCTEQPSREKRILVFSRTGGWQHSSIPHGIAAIQQLGAEHGFRVDTTKNAAYFTEDSLKQYSAVVFLSTRGNVLDHRQQADFERYIQAGGGFVGIHSATDTEYDWPWYGKLAGAYFESHPDYPDSSKQNAVLTVVDRKHPATEFLPDTWQRFDEWYSFKQMNPDVQVLLTIDEQTYTGGKLGAYHPMAWYHAFDGGRAFYTALGHTDESYAEPLFRQHLLGGIRYAIGENQPLDYSKARSLRVPDETRFTQQVLAANLNEPMELAVADDGRVIFVERHGTVRVYNPSSGQVSLAAQLNVFSQKEDGLLGLALDPDFSRNQWLYLFYSPAGTKPIQRVSRFVLDNDSLRLSSEKILLEIPVIRSESNHSGGSLAFGPDGNLFISLGDNTVPFASDGYAPIDERPGRAPWDAQKSSGNPNDLRGKILRIHPEPDGTYTIPAGNLFPEGTAGTRPEIYVMGNRNPFRISIDPRTGFLYWGEVGPDAGEDSTGRGPKGYDEVNQARKAGNFGWPYFIGNNKPYHAYNFVTQKSGAAFNPEAPVNNSPNNTGIRNLPPAQNAFIWYPYDASAEFPIVGEGGRSAMAGPVYYHDDFKVAEKRFPRYYDGKLIIYEWMRNWVMAVTMDAEGNLEKIEPFLASMNFAKPVDMQFGKDGALYVLEYGTYWSSQNADSKLSKIEFWEGNRPPVARVIASRTVGRAPLTVKFSSEGTFDHDPGDRLTYAWSFTGTNQVHSNDPNPSFTFDKPGVYRPRLTVSDARGAQATAQVEISVGNEAPEIAFALTGNRTFYWDGRKVNYEVMVTDAEDGSLDKGISPEDVTVTLDYLPQGKDLIGVVQGHQEAATASGSPGTGKVLIENSDCKACHALDRKSVGPAYQEIARRYKDDSKAVHTLATKIIKGGSGNWGDHAMSAHPQLSETDAREMVRYILALEDTKNRMPVRGSFTARSAASDAGKYILSASYTDTGGAETGPLTTRKELVLRPAKVSASGYDEARGVARKNDPENNRPFLRFSEHGSFIVFNGVDLSGISQLTLRVSSNQLPGTMEVRLGSPEGTLIGQVKVIPGGKWHELSAPLVPTNGEHDVYVVYVYDEGPAEKVTIWNTVNLEWIHFHPANAL